MELLTVTEKAQEFLAKSGYSFAWLEKAELDKSKDQWRLIYNVSLTGERTKTVTVDNSTGKVVGFE